MKELIMGIDVIEHLILENKNAIIENYLIELMKIIEIIKPMTLKISLSEIGQDLSFELIIEIIKEKQKDLFSTILNMKNINKEISEMNITMQSLENILTSLN